MTAQWRKAPLALGHHRSVLLAVLLASGLLALTASASPFLSTAAGSEALKNKLSELDPLTVGLVLSGLVAPPSASPARLAPHRPNTPPRLIAPARSSAKAAAVTIGRSTTALTALAARLGSLGNPIETLETPDTVPATSASGGFDEVQPIYRTDALAHVRVLSRAGGAGIWIADTTARELHVRAGDTIVLTGSSSFGAGKAKVRVAGIYRALAYRPVEAPFWVNFIQQIYPPSPASSPPPPFAFTTRAGFLRLWQQLNVGEFEAIHEIPIDPRHLTLPAARALATRFAAVSRSLGSARSSLTRALACERPDGCMAVSSLSSAVLLANDDVSAISPVVTLLSDLGIAIALAVAAAAGVFAVRRRQTEAALMFARGEHVVVFSARTGLEALLPLLVGGVAGFALTVALTGELAPRGTIDAPTFQSGAWHAAAVVGIGLCLLAGASGLAFARLHDTGTHGRRVLRYLPWELPVFAIAAYLFFDIRSGGGLATSGASGTAHPTLAVFVLPLLLGAGTAGLGARLAQLGLRRGFRRWRSLPTPVFLALRRLAAARGLLIALTVVSAVAFGAFFYAEVLDESLSQTTIEKGYIGYGSDGEGMVASSAPLPRSFPYPATTVEYGNGSAAFGGASGEQADVLAVDPATLPAVLHWESDWGADPAALLGRLSASRAVPLPVIVTSAAPVTLRAVWIQGARYPVRVIGRVHAFPGMTDRPLVVVSRTGLARATAALHLEDPLYDASIDYVWAKGPPVAVGKALSAPNLDVSYIETVDTFRRNPDVVLATRTYSYLQTIAIGAAALALVGLLLYLQARQRSQAIATALSQRMGLTRGAEIVSLTLELAAILVVAVVVGAGAALAAAALVVSHIDLLPQYPPAPILAIPWGFLWGVAGALAVVALAAGTATSWAARRSDVGEALRVA